MTVERMECNPMQLVEDVRMLMAGRAQQKDVNLTAKFEAGVPARVMTDPVRLKQILINVFNNAIKFTEQGSVAVVVRFIEQQGAEELLQFDITDTGIGLSPEQLARLFRAFTQADASTTRKFGGTGLGLTISKQLAKLLGGDVFVLHSELGVGTTFRVEVSAAKAVSEVVFDSKTQHAPPESADSATHSKLSGYRVLLVEDALDLQRLVCMILRKAGANVTVVDNGLLAVREALRAKELGLAYDCVLMDMQMPVMDGYKATADLRSLEYTGLIIALTAHSMSSERARCIHAGCDDYATKPVERERLIELIASNVQHGKSAA